MGPKIGRPKMENPNTVQLTIRINKSLSIKLEEHCRKYSVSKGEVVRNGIEKILGEKEK